MSQWMKYYVVLTTFVFMGIIQKPTPRSYFFKNHLLLTPSPILKIMGILLFCVFHIFKCGQNVIFIRRKMSIFTHLLVRHSRNLELAYIARDTELLPFHLKTVISTLSILHCYRTSLPPQ
jgi:hypothetical protein